LWHSFLDRSKVFPLVAPVSQCVSSGLL
jgi:hypothetical protein